MYENGDNLIPDNMSLTASSYNGQALTETDTYNFFAGYLSSYLWAATLQQQLHAFLDAGGVTPCYYMAIGGWSKSGMWAAIAGNLYTTPPPLWTVLTAFNSGYRNVPATSA